MSGVDNATKLADVGLVDGETGEGRVFTICKKDWFSVCLDFDESNRVQLESNWD